MPTSSQDGKTHIKRIVGALKHDRMLDIGCGEGTYAKLFPDADWTGIEVWEPYVEAYGLKSLYSKLIIADARTYVFEPEDRFDIAFAGDVLEHMTQEEAKALLDRLRQVADTVIASIPIGHFPQGDWGGNPHERHIVDDWTDARVKEAFGKPSWSAIDGEIGVYVWSKHQIMIPKVIHMIWVGDEAKRPDNYIQTWKDMNPDWTVKVWGNREYSEENWVNKARMETMWQRQLCGVADMMRYEILYNEGGFYVDADSQCLRPLEDWLFDSALCVSWENETVREGLIACGYIAAKAGDHRLLKVIEEIKADDDIENKPAWYGTGPRRLTGVLKAEPDSYTVWPSHYFIPDHFDGFTYTGTGPVFSSHDWGTTKNLYDNLHKRGRKLKIAVYAISKNEEMFVEKFCNSAKGADYVIIADTGSTDNTVESAKAAGAIVHSICITPWRFDLARNAALALIPADVDICISLDLDEVLEPGWREEIERVWTEKTTRLRYFFDWGCGIKFKYEKIHARKGYMWHHPCHEYPIPDPRTKEVWSDTDMLLVSHHPDPTKSRGQYLDLLEVSVKEDPRCPRNAFYYARELSFYRKWDEAIVALNRYLTMPEATWGNERCYAYRVLGQCYEEKGMQWEAEGAYHKACAEAPNTREPWCAISLLKYRQSQWAECYGAAMRALSIKDKQLVYTCDPEVWGFKAHDLASISAWHLGLRDISIEQAQLAVEAAPDNQRLKANLEFVKGKKIGDDGDTGNL